MTRHYTPLDVASARKWLDPSLNKISTIEELDKLLDQLAGDELVKDKIRVLIK